jgi:hypothetical protein
MKTDSEREACHIRFDKGEKPEEESPVIRSRTNTPAAVADPIVLPSLVRVKQEPQEAVRNPTPSPAREVPI